MSAALLTLLRLLFAGALLLFTLVLLTSLRRERHL